MINEYDDKIAKNGKIGSLKRLEIKNSEVNKAYIIIVYSNNRDFGERCKPYKNARITNGNSNPHLTGRNAKIVSVNMGEVNERLLENS